MLKHDVGGAAEFAESFLTTPVPIDGIERLRAHAAAHALMAHAPQAGWSSVWPAMQADAKFGREVFLTFPECLALRGGNSSWAKELPTTELVLLVAWIEELFPTDANTRNSGFRARFVTPEDRVGELQNVALAELVSRGTPEVISALERFQLEFPNRDWSWSLLTAREAACQNTWEPRSPREIIDLRPRSVADPVVASPARRPRDHHERSAKVDLLLVVATDTEHEALLRAAQAISGRPQPTALIYGAYRTYQSLGAIGGALVAVVQTEPGTATVGGSLATILTAIGEVGPPTIIMVGIAFGVDPEKQPIGHVLVAKQVQQYEIQRIGTDAGGTRTVIPRGDKATASPSVMSRLRASRTAHQSEFTVEFGLMLSGEKLVDNLDYRTELRAFEPEALGGEMEAGGLYVAAVERQVAWCVVKGVCDYADGHKRENKEARQNTAAENAAKFVLHSIAAGGFARRDGPADAV